MKHDLLTTSRRLIVSLNNVDRVGGYQEIFKDIAYASQLGNIGNRKSIL